MTRTIHFIWDDDAYEVEVDGLEIRAIWRFRNNRTTRPEFLSYKRLDEQLRNEIDHKLLKAHGEPNNGLG